MDRAIEALLDMPNDLPFAPTTYAPIVAPAGLATEPHEYRAEITDPDAIRRFIEAGHALFTLVSKKSGKRITYKLTRPKPEKSRNPNRPIWVSILSGSDNTGDYTFTGSIWLDATGYVYRPGKNSRVSMTAPSMVLLTWFLKRMNGGDEAGILRQAEFWHEGKCGRCGRTLTVPESIASGYGPECITLV